MHRLVKTEVHKFVFTNYAGLKLGLKNKNCIVVNSGAKEWNKT